jgi:hypothetical protein
VICANVVEITDNHPVMRSEVLTVVNIMIMVFLDVTPCSLTDRYYSATRPHIPQDVFIIHSHNQIILRRFYIRVIL